MKLKVLGTGSSGNCYLLLDCGQILILDAGIGIKDIKIGLNFDVSSVVGAFITHCHADHSASADSLRNMGIPVFEPYKSDREFASVDMGGYTVKSFSLPHDGTENRGAYIICPSGHKVLYMTDFEYCAYTFRKKEIETFLIECNYSVDVDGDQANIDHIIRGHASLEVTKGVVSANLTDKARNIVLCHLSSANAEPYRILKEISSIVPEIVNVKIARKGLEMEL